LRLSATDARRLGLNAKGRPKPNQSDMNKLERRYAEVLEGRRIAGEIALWRFGCVTFKLGTDCRYTPDFFVMMPDGLIELHETKGFQREDSRVKQRTAVTLFPWFGWKVIRAKGKEFTVEDLNPNCTED
jgi:hypothetical protein